MSGTTTAPCWDDFEAVALTGLDRLILHGPPGTGKTYTALTHDVGAGGSFRLICTPDMTSADVAGAFMPAREGFEYVPGAGLLAWLGNGEVGGRLVVDEVDQASGDVLSQLLAFTDSAGSARFTHPVTGETLRPLPGFSVVMTSNIDEADDLPAALRDRFPVALRIDRAHPEAVALLPEDLRGIASRLAGTRVGSRHLSLRAFYALAELRDGLGFEDAVRLVLGPAAQDFMDLYRLEAVGA